MACPLSRAEGLPQEIREAVEGQDPFKKLSKDAVIRVLRAARFNPSCLSRSSPTNPHAGELFLINGKACRAFRRDGHRYWIKPESHARMYANGKPIATACYAHSSVRDATGNHLQRRVYRLLEARDVILVHYFSDVSTRLQLGPLANDELLDDERDEADTYAEPDTELAAACIVEDLSGARLEATGEAAASPPGDRDGRWTPSAGSAPVPGASHAAAQSSSCSVGVASSSPLSRANPAPGGWPYHHEPFLCPSSQGPAAWDTTSHASPRAAGGGWARAAQPPPPSWELHEDPRAGSKRPRGADGPGAPPPYRRGPGLDRALALADRVDGSPRAYEPLSREDAPHLFGRAGEAARLGALGQGPTYRDYPSPSAFPPYGQPPAFPGSFPSPLGAFPSSRSPGPYPRFGSASDPDSAVYPGFTHGPALPSGASGHPQERATPPLPRTAGPATPGLEPARAERDAAGVLARDDRASGCFRDSWAAGVAPAPALGPDARRGLALAATFERPAASVDCREQWHASTPHATADPGVDAARSAGSPVPPAASPSHSVGSDPDADSLLGSGWVPTTNQPSSLLSSGGAFLPDFGSLELLLGGGGSPLGHLLPPTRGGRVSTSFDAFQRASAAGDWDELAPLGRFAAEAALGSPLPAF